MTGAPPGQILVVEDSDEDFETVREAAAALGLERALLRATRVDECLALLDAPRSPIALVILDLNVPGDGRSLLEVIRGRATGRTVPVVVVSASSNPRDIDACYRAGASAYHTKPTAYPVHLEKLRTLLAYWSREVTWPAQPARPEAAREPPPSAPREPWRIVVIDDNPDDRAEVRRLLLRGSGRSYTFSEAGTAALGVRAVLDHPERPPRCVVLDYYLPDANAPQVLEALTGAERLTTCPVVVLTGGSSHDLGAAVLRAGAQDYVGKGWLTAESLTRAIENAVERHAMAIERRKAELALAHAADEREHLLQRERDARRGAEQASAALQAAERERARFTAELAAERAKLYAVVMRTPVSVAVFEGPEARYALVNDAYRRFVADRPLEGRLLRDAFPELADHPLVESVYEAYRTGEPITLEERAIELPVPGGGTRTSCFTVSFLPIHDERGRITGVITAGTDVTDQVRAREALESSLRFAEQFVGVLGHDLRNPLQAIVAAASALDARGTDDPERRLIARIQASAERMASMVAQLLDLTRLRLGGGIVLDRSRVSLHAIVANVVDELRQIHPSRRIACALGPEVRGEWDAERLSQVVSNLVGNAIQYGDPALPIDVTITTRGDEVALAVHNVGPPIPRALLPAIFEPYRRGERRGGTAQGLGLGLYIAHQIVLGHGGHLDLDSTEDGHTTFTVVLHRSRDRSPPGSP